MRWSLALALAFTTGCASPPRDEPPAAAGPDEARRRAELQRELDLGDREQDEAFEAASEQHRELQQHLSAPAEVRAREVGD